MPNYVANKLSVTIKNEEMFDKFLNAVKSEESDFDFNKIIPMPDCLKGTEESGATHNAIYYYLFRNGKTDEYAQMCTFPMHNLDKVLEQKTSTELEEMYKVGEKYYKIFQETGAISWYYWNLKNWGTKWNASDVSMYENNLGVIFFFQTAWSGVPEIINRLHTMFPELEFDYLYADEDFTYNCGKGYTEDGDFIFHQIENGSDSAFQAYCECWGEDEDDFIKEDGYWVRREDYDEFEDEE